MKGIIVTDTLNLSKRLTMIASFLPQGAYFADIGSDHAYLPCYVCLYDQTARALAGEVNVGPYKSACETVSTYGLLDQIDVRLGDGLEVLRNDPVEQIVIAGMGGSLIKKILNSGKQSLSSVERIIAQPNIGEKNVREWFLENNFAIINEVIIEENDHFYEVIIADRVINNQPYSDNTLQKDLFFGPKLLNERSASFLKKWAFQEKKFTKILDQMKQASIQDHKKIKQLELELDWIKEVINYGENNS